MPFQNPSSAFPPAAAGRFEAKIRYDPSGAIVGSMSRHSPEKDAIVGADHVPFRSCEMRIADWLGLDRVKKTVRPSGVNAGNASFAGPGDDSRRENTRRRVGRACRMSRDDSGEEQQQQMRSHEASRKTSGWAE